MRSFLLGTVALVSTACSSSDGPTDPLVPADPLPSSSGSFAARYLVPTDDPALAEAAVFPVDHVDWTVVGGAVTLHYPLPPGLVGGDLDVTFDGSLPAGSTRIAIGGAQGTGSCVAAGTTVSCFEVFGDLGTLPISMTVVEQVAAQEYAGPVEYRATIATLFGTDPVGIVEIDFSSPIVEDNPRPGDDSP